VRHPRIVVGVAVLAVGLPVGSALAWSHRAPPRADVFMHSVEVRDGRMGWQQLCPAAQAELPLSELVQETDALRAADRASGMRVSMTFVRSEPRPEGGERRYYLATARRAAGSDLVQRTFMVSTQADGCVEAVD
jgi:hypothetical protein